MKPRKIQDTYGDTVTVTAEVGEEAVLVYVGCKFSHSANCGIFAFTPEQSRELRKALKRAERRA